MSSVKRQAQTKLDSFIKKKRNNSNVNHQKSNHQTHIKKEKQQHSHNSSRQNSDTQVMEPLSHQREAQLNKQQNQPKQKIVNKSLILAGPADSIYYPSIQKKLQKLRQNYNPQNKSVFIEFLFQNLKYQGVKNVDNMKKIKDTVFWQKTLPFMMKLIMKKAQSISSCIYTLVSTTKIDSIISREQILLILISMFFGILPKNPLCQNSSFKQFMHIRENDKNENIKLEKLRFIINYFNQAVQQIQNSSQFGDQFVVFQRASLNQFQWKRNLKTDDYDRNFPMLNVQFPDYSKGLIQDYYGRAAMVDFANKDIGGGVLKQRGSVQEQILFLIFPQAIVSMLISDTMKDNQAIIIYGLRRYSNYEGYSDSLKFDGPYCHVKELENINNSIMIAIDAVDFTEKVKTDVQFEESYIHRQLLKALTGFMGIQYACDNSDFKICTGRWGCGAFKGDDIMKFFIQWVACSQAGRSMIYISDNKELVQELQFAVQMLVKSNTLDMLSLMVEFGKFKKLTKAPQSYTFLKYLKSYAVKSM